MKNSIPSQGELPIPDGVAPNPAAASRDLDQDAQRGHGLLALGGILAALGASSCCALPLVFFSVGVGGAWLAYLTALAPYQPLFLTAALAFLAAGFWRTYWQPHIVCKAAGACARPGFDRAARIGLWVGTALIFAAVIFPHAAALLL